MWFHGHFQPSLSWNCFHVSESNDVWQRGHFLRKLTKCHLFYTVKWYWRQYPLRGYRSNSVSPAFAAGPEGCWLVPCHRTGHTGTYLWTVSHLWQCLSWRSHGRLLNTGRGLCSEKEQTANETFGYNHHYILFLCFWGDINHEAALFILHDRQQECWNDSSLDVEDVDWLVRLGVKLDTGGVLHGELQRVPGWRKDRLPSYILHETWNDMLSLCLCKTDLF